MTAVRFALATQADDAGIRHLLATNALPGKIRLRFEREPDYFAGLVAMGPSTQVLVAKDGERVVGVACRAVQRLYINGVAEDIGYLGQLRVDRSYRGTMIVPRGFQKLRELHAGERARGYYTTIVEGNAEAEGVLVTRARRSMPRYRMLDRLVIMALPAKRGGNGARRSTADDAATLLRQVGPTRNFFPAGTPQGEIVAIDGGAAALCDHRASRQTIIDGYAPALRFARPFYNLFSRIPLPPPGSHLEHGYVTHFCVRDDDPSTARTLVAELQKQAASQSLDHILLGFTESDPLLAAVRRLKPVEYRSTIYTVAWSDEDDFHDRLDSRPRALDIAAL